MDVYGYSSFTLWTCGCNLRCPFCHNWRLAEKAPGLCKEVDVDKILEELEASKVLVDYIHVTGGEPLLQYQALMMLFSGAGTFNIKRSLNSNLTLPHALKQLLKESLVDHVATDLKVPPIELYGVDRNVAELLWRKFIESLRIVKEHNVKLELRIPVWKKITPEILSKYLDEIEDSIDRENTLILLNPLLGEPYVEPRDPAWCKENCVVSQDQVESLTEILRVRGFNNIVVRSVPGFKV